MRGGAALQTIKAEKGVFRKVKGVVTQAQGFRKELLGAKYCTIKFNFIKGSEYSRNYQCINNESSHISKIEFRIEADNTGNFIEKLFFLKKDDDLVEVQFLDIGPFTYVVKSGLIDQLFNLGNK